MVSTAERARLEEELRAHKQLREEADRITRAQPIVIEVPFQQPAAELNVRRCCRLYSDGRQCDSPAMEGYDECLRHYRWYSLLPPVHVLALPEDALALQEVMARAVDLVMRKRLSAEEAHAIAHLCRIMEKNLWRCERELRGR